MQPVPKIQAIEEVFHRGHRIVQTGKGEYTVYEDGDLTEHPLWVDDTIGACIEVIDGVLFEIDDG